MSRNTPQNDAAQKAAAEAKAKAEKEAKEKAEAEAKAKAEDEAKKKASGKAKFLVVVASQRQRRRAGRAFGKDPVKIAVDELTDDERIAIERDPVLAVAVVSE